MLRKLPRPPLAIFAWTRLLIWGATALTYLVFEAQYAQPLHTGGAEDVVQHDVGWAIDVWARWDSGWFLRIAEHGYHAGAEPAFYPLYPLLVRLLGPVFGGHYVLAGLLVSLAASLGAFYLLHHLAEARLGMDGARRAVLLRAAGLRAVLLDRDEEPRRVLVAGIPRR